MSIEGLFNHQVRLYRETVTLDAGGDTVSTWGAISSTPTSNNAWADQAWSGVLQDLGAGEEMSTGRRWFLSANLSSVRERDVISVTAGPESPKLLRVLAVTRATAPQTLHHIEVNVEVWEGSL